MASEELGELGADQGDPVLVDWRWHYSVPSAPLWIILAALLVVPKHNRNLQAWLILILPLLVVVFVGLFRAAFGTWIDDLDGMVQFVVTFAIAWTGVWLLGPWLPGRSRLGVSIYSLGTMFLLGGIGYFGYFGFSGSIDSLLPACFWVVSSVTLVAAMAWTGWCCRDTFGPWQLMLWPIVWLPAVSLFTIPVFVLTIIVTVEGGNVGDAEQILMMVVFTLVVAVMLSGGLYLFTLPVMLLNAFNPCYRERFRSRYCPLSVTADEVVVVPPQPIQPVQPVQRPAPSGDGNPFGF